MPKNERTDGPLAQPAPATSGAAEAPTTATPVVIIPDTLVVLPPFPDNIDVRVELNRNVRDGMNRTDDEA